MNDLWQVFKDGWNYRGGWRHLGAFWFKTLVVATLVLLVMYLAARL